MQLIQTFKKKLESELQGFCTDILKLLDSHLLPKVKNSDSKVFYLKMKGDYYRYLGEFVVGE